MLRIYFLVLCLFVVIPLVSHAGKKWDGVIPECAKNQDQWKQLLKTLVEKEFPYGAMAASQRMLTFFSDLSTKELAYRHIVALIDQGYSLSTNALFITGDLEPVTKEHFTESYHFYKALTNQERGMEKWAKHHLGLIDTEKSPKYLLYRAIKKYEDKDLSGSVKILERLLAEKSDTLQESFYKKVARTLARIRFEQERFEEAFEVYNDFLLRLNPVNPSDWLEAAWTLYHLKQYEKALGYVYNLDSKSASDAIDLEKYVLRALIYREYCAVDSMRALASNFDGDFGKAVHGIRIGNTMVSYPELKTILHPKNRRFFQVYSARKKLEAELKRINELPLELKKLASYLYSSEIQVMKKLSDMYEEESVARTGNHLIMLGESIRFLSFDVAREKHNPDAVFQGDAKDRSRVMENMPDNKFQILWEQTGDYWRDERLLYRGKIKNQCSG